MPTIDDIVRSTLGPLGEGWYIKSLYAETMTHRSVDDRYPTEEPIAYSLTIAHRDGLVVESGGPTINDAVKVAVNKVKRNVSRELDP